MYITQPNLGGAGGFTRGLYEVAGVAGADHANVIFMDDDVICEPDVLIRLNAFANLTVEPVIVGAQMLHLLQPGRLHIGAEFADFGELRPGIATQHALVNCDMTEQTRSVASTAPTTAGGPASSPPKSSPASATRCPCSSSGTTSRTLPRAGSRACHGDSARRRPVARRLCVEGP